MRERSQRSVEDEYKHGLTNNKKRQSDQHTETETVCLEEQRLLTTNVTNKGCPSNIEPKRLREYTTIRRFTSA